MIALRRNLHNVLAEAAPGAGAEIVTGSRVLSATDRRQAAAGGRVERSRRPGGRHGRRLLAGARLARARAVDRRAARRLRPPPDPAHPGRPGQPDDRDVERRPPPGRRTGQPATLVYIFLCCPEADTEWRAPAAVRPGRRGFGRTRGTASQIERIPRNPEGRWLNFWDVNCHAWSRGNVALLGDSAHAMSPEPGSGRVCGARQRGRARPRPSREARTSRAHCQAWEQRQRPITERAQRYSEYYGAIGTKWPHEPPPARRAQRRHPRCVPAAARRGGGRRSTGEPVSAGRVAAGEPSEPAQGGVR